jgi:hypothetical protein
MDLVLIILSETISYDGSSVSQCMRRLTVPDGTGGPSACIFPNLVELNVHDDAEWGASV